MIKKIKNKEYLSFYKAREIAEKINKMSEEDINLDQYSSLDTLAIEDLEKIEELANRFPSNFMLERAQSLNPNRDADRLVKAILELKKRKRTNIYKFAVSFAAALIAISFVIWNTKNNNEINIISYNSYNEAISVPMLVLGNGEKIDLDNEKGEIQLENSKIKKVRENAISYDQITDSAIVNHKIIIPSKYSYEITLSDSSQVVLNAGSTLKYPSSFSGSNRRVELSGEGYFKITKSDIPFIVSVDSIEIEVYGTEFNIRNTTANTIETILVKGSIGVRIKEDNEVKMEPNQKYVYNQKENLGELTMVNVDNHLQWLSNNFKYTEEDIETVLRDIAVWYGVKFIEIDKIENHKITLFASRTFEIGDILNFIEKLTDLKFTKKGGETYNIERK